MGDSFQDLRFKKTLDKSGLLDLVGTRKAGPLSGLGISSLAGTFAISERRRCPQFSLSLESHLSSGI